MNIVFAVVYLLASLVWLIQAVRDYHDGNAWRGAAVLGALLLVGAILCYLLVPVSLPQP